MLPGGWCPGGWKSRRRQFSVVIQKAALPGESGGMCAESVSPIPVRLSH